MEKILLEPGKLLASTLSPDDPPKVIDPPELELLKNASKAFDNAAQAAAANVSKASNDSSLVSLKNIKGMDVVQKIEKSDQDAFIGANALSMIHGGDDNETDMLSLKFVTNNKDDYLVCAKSDGVRYLMFITSDGKVYLNDRKCQYFEVKTFIPPFFLDDKPGQNTRVVYIFDGELILNSEDQKKIEKAEEKGKTNIEEGEIHAKKLKISLHYLIFDTLMHSGEHCILKKYLHRLEFAKKFVQKADYYTEFFPEAQASLSKNHNLQSYFPINFYLKDFYTCRQIEFLLNSVINKNVLPHENDGLIFTKNNYPYFPGKNRGILKWKPSKLNTIDFFVTENIEYGHKYPQLFEDGDFQVLELYTIYGDYMHFMDFLFLNQEKYIEMMSHFRNYTIGKNEFNGIIVECNYDHNLVNSKFIDFLDLAYEASSDGVEKIIKNSRLYLEWEQKTNLTLETNKKNWGIMREKLLGEIQQKEKDLQCIKNHDEREKAEKKLKSLKDNEEITREFIIPRYPGPADHSEVIFTIMDSRFKDSGQGIYARGGWVPLRMRGDKDFPNNFNTAKAMIDTIFKSNISEEELIEKLCVAPQEEAGGNKKVKK